MSSKLPILYYAHDPMCSWCWGFRPVWKRVQEGLVGKVNVRSLLGGLAADCDQPMPLEMQHAIENTWKKIQRDITGVEFNYKFWQLCQPRRSTYPACRAIIACKMQQPELESEMLLAVQHAYYLDAKNPSDLDVLIKLAEEIGLDADLFKRDISSENCQNLLMNEIEFCRSLYIHSFPSLVLQKDESFSVIEIDYNDSTKILKQIPH